jgi:diguanylate cyclase (GGDEF)-like protein
MLVSGLSAAHRVSAAVDALVDSCLLLLDRDFGIVHASASTRHVLGWSPEDMDGRPAYELIHPDDLEFALAEMSRIAADAEPGAELKPGYVERAVGSVELRVVQPDGSYIQAEFLSYELHTDPDVAALTLWCRRVAEPSGLDRAMEQMADGAALTEVLATLVRYLLEDPGLITAHLVVFGREASRVVGVDGEIAAADERWPALVRSAESVLVGRPPRSDVEHVVPIREPGRDRPSGAIVQSLHRRITMGGRHIGIGTARIAGAAIAVERAMEQLRLIAGLDGLTGLRNRASLEAWLDELGATGAACGLMVVDLDGFKAVNDTHGHAAGDAVLVEIGRRLGVTIRDADRVARLGGDEFVILCSGASSELDLDPLVLRVAAVCAQPVEVGDGHVARVAASIGVAVPRAGEDLRAALRRADLACLADKTSRRAAR